VIAYRTVGHDQNSVWAAAELDPRRGLDSNGGAGRAGRPLDAEVPVDELDLQGAVVGDRLILSEYGPDDPLELHRVHGGRAALLGAFENAAAAWRALDDLDAPPPAA
jgi:hypothetical protein